ncbi:UrcA family protein [Phenylobacterium montanum]|uniref:UrcA family protein n=1 Tax=Phenylobacterium montanum TaxID=2823693 RepID=A0A975G0W3_9CAUL|nr:UrcA family protein [Caulobacter sp. S6]QUD89068.1 UrcA family protein [Caulobacter sp. S6]
MARQLIGLRTKLSAFAAASVFMGGCLIAGAPAMAQQVDEVTVTAPRVVEHRASGARNEHPATVTLSRGVGYADLNLATQAGAATLEQRIKDTASGICAQLYDIYPETLYLPNPTGQDCVAVAVDGGMTQAKAVIEATRKIAMLPNEVTVTAPRLVVHRVSGARGQNPESVSLSRRVQYGDLDLATQAGAAALKERVKETASLICSQLNDLYPESLYLPNPSGQDCLSVAVDGGMTQANAAITLAHK